jgi:hypothetical protein
MKEKLPDLSDIMASGMGLTEALAFWNEMMNSPDRNLDYWWGQIQNRDTTSRRRLAGRALH